MDERTDPRLLALALSGDQDAFGILIERYRPVAQRLAVQITGDQEVARELVQDAIVQAYLSLDHLRDTTRFKSWFYGIMLNVCRTYWRTQKVRQISLEALMEEQSLEEIWLPDGEIDPQEVVMERELHHLMLHAITRLSSKNRAVILLFYYGQLSLREIAHTLEISMVAVKSRLKQARKALREQLLQMYPELRPVPQKRKGKSMHTVTIADVLQQGPHSIAILVDADGRRALPLWIGYGEGQAIVAALRTIQTPGPLSFALMTDLLQAAESELEEVRLATLKDDILYAILRLRHGKTSKEIEARVSDALALAAQTNCSISVADDILQNMGLDLPEGQTKLPQEELERILHLMRGKQPQEPLTGHTIAPYPQQPRNLDGAEGLSGWVMTGSQMQNYDYQFDPQVKQNGLSSFSLKAKVSEAGGHGAFLQTIKADLYRGKLLRLSAMVKTEDVQPRATLMIYAHGPNSQLKFAGNARGPMTGTQDWTLCEAMLKIPEEYSRLTFGMILSGTGQVWFNEVQFITIEQFSLPETAAPLSKAPVPLNADLAQGVFKQVISYAQEEARRLQHNYVGTEHLLLALLHEPGPAEILRSLGAESEKVRLAVETIIGRGPSAVSGEIELTPRTRKVFELAWDEARLLEHPAPGTEDILLGMLREGEGIAAGVLQSLGVRYKEVVARTL